MDDLVFDKHPVSSVRPLVASFSARSPSLRGHHRWNVTRKTVFISVVVVCLALVAVILWWVRPSTERITFVKSIKSPQGGSQGCDCAPDQVCSSRGHCYECVHDQDCGSGQVCRSNRCFTTCTGPSSCPQTHPNCVEGVCMECTFNQECPSTSPFCIHGKCSECLTSSNCADQLACVHNVCVPGCGESASPCQEGYVCHPTLNACVQCLTSKNCAGNTPFCDAARFTCVECEQNTDCQEHGGGVCNSKGSCSYQSCGAIDSSHSNASSEAFMLASVSDPSMCLDVDVNASHRFVTMRACDGTKSSQQWVYYQSKTSSVLRTASVESGGYLSPLVSTSGSVEVSAIGAHSSVPFLILAPKGSGMAIVSENSTSPPPSSPSSASHHVTVHDDEASNVSWSHASSSTPSLFVAKYIRPGTSCCSTWVE